MNDPQIVPVEDFIESLQGRVIEGGEVNSDGMHLNLDDGRTLIVLGVVYVGRTMKETVQ